MYFKCARLPGAFMIVAFSLQYVYACSCAFPSGSIKRQVDHAKREAVAVFSGKVTEVLRTDGGRRLRVQIAVERVWKGNIEQKITIYTGGGDCGYQFSPATVYLVYAYAGEEGQLWTNICTRTRTQKFAAADVRYLGRPTKPILRKVT